MACAPEPYVSPLVWDGADNMVFRPLVGLFAVRAPREAVNVNAFDEVPDSAWFTNRIGRKHPPLPELLRGACAPELLLPDDPPAEGTWIIDRGKTDGASLGFRVRTKAGSKYMFKNDAPNQPERATAASAIGAAIYHAVGFNTSCEQIVYFDRKALHLNPGLTSKDNSGMTKAFDTQALDRVLSEANRRGPLFRMQASAWLEGYLLGPFRYEGTRRDDPNDIIPHEERRELRGGRVLAAWINHFDAREQNSMDAWFAAGSKVPDSSPGHVLHYYIDTSDCFGSEWQWDGISRRLGHSYVFDWADVGLDTVTFGFAVRPWERVQRRNGFELFGYYSADEFQPAAWKNEYPNAAFSRATEHDNAWMARILSRFDDADISALVKLGDFTKPEHAAYLEEVLELRLQRILGRYFAELSPLSDPQLTATGQLCLTDLARRRGVWPERAFQYTASVHDHTGAAVIGAAAPLRKPLGGGVCVALPELPIAPDVAHDSAQRYFTVTIDNGISRYPVRIHLYDLGAEGHRVVGLERPDSR